MDKAYIFELLMDQGRSIDEGKSWPYAAMSRVAGVNIRNHRPLLYKVLAHLERELVFFRTMRGVALTRCSPYDMVLEDDRQLGFIAKRARKQVRKLKTVDVIRLDEAQRQRLINRMGWWNIVEEESTKQLRQSAGKRTRIEKRQRRRQQQAASKSETLPAICLP